MKLSKKAEERALNAAQLTVKGKELLRKAKQTNALVAATEHIMKDEPTAMSTYIFVLAITLEVTVSWEIYRQIASANAARWSWLLTPCMGLIIIGWAALTAYYLGKKFKKSLFELEQARLEKAGLSSEEAKEKTSQRTEKQFNIGLLSGVTLLATVIFISFYRIHLLEIAEKGDYNLGDLLFPVLFVVLEIWAGFYIGYVWFIFMSHIKSHSYERALKHCKNQIIQETKMAVIHYEEALEAKEKFTASKHLNDAIYRWHSLSIENENYFEPISQPFMPNGMEKMQPTI